MAADLKSRFEKAAKDLNALDERPSDQDLLQLYALYKQATVGDVNGSRPGAFDFRGRAKYDAWAERKGMSAEAAMKDYVARVGRLSKRR
jgi:diazepam-binding inhibitor (GABA receptor modulator, acyl-CoA-binding protein)